jgi:hypothetical protein
VANTRPERPAATIGDRHPRRREMTFGPSRGAQSAHDAVVVTNTMSADTVRSPAQ